MAHIGNLAYYGFGDEASGPEARSKYFVFAVLVTPRSHPVEVQVRRLIRKTGKHLVGNEIKASQTDRKIVKQLLIGLAELDIAVAATIVDKRDRPFSDAEGIYRRTVGLTIRQCADRWLSLDVTLDKRYTSLGQQAKLDRAIALALTEEQQTEVHVHTGVSFQMKPLQAADCVAWAIWQKYEREETELYQVLAKRIVVENVVRWKNKSGMPGL